MNEYEGPERRAHHGWHLDRRVNLSHLAATVSLAAAVLTWSARMDTRVSILESDSKRQDEILTQTNTETTRRLDRIEAKLDRVIESATRGR